jgi:hypothetical protein
MLVCMILMEGLKELSTIENPWSYSIDISWTSSTGALERNGTA